MRAVILFFLILSVPSICLSEVLDGFWKAPCSSENTQETRMSKGVFYSRTAVEIGPEPGRLGRTIRYILVAWPDKDNYSGVWVTVPDESRLKKKEIVEGDEIAVTWRVQSVKGSGSECLFSREGISLSKIVH